ncbi:MAG: hypothetical protein LBH29_02345 [Elusimicrobiota bacterium]|nr:hypothetical protein [Elusimicrobiota bacterium]
MFLFKKILSKKRINWRFSLLTIILWTIVFVVFALFEYSKISFGINQASLWVDRYLFTLLPYFYLLCAFSAIKCIDFLCRKDMTAKSIIIVCLAFFLFFNTLIKVDENNRSRYIPDGPYKDWANYLIAQKDIYDKGTAVFIRMPIWDSKRNKTRGAGLKVFANYYVSQKGAKTPVLFAAQEDLENAVFKRLYVLIDPNDKETYISDKYKQSFTKDIYGAKVLVYDRIEN